MHDRNSTPIRPGLIILFVRFLRLGMTAFGGPAMVGYIREMAINKQGWLTPESFKQGVAISQTIPGATAMQVAAYVGLRARGTWGAIAAYIGFGLPAFVLMILLSALYQQSRNLAVITSIFNGLQVVVVALVAHATFHFGRTTARDWRAVFLGLAVAGFLFLDGNPVLAIGAAAALGCFLFRTKDSEAADPTPQPHPWSFVELLPTLLLCAILTLGLALLFAVDRQLAFLAVMMAKIDLFAFGGGYGSVPLMFNEVVVGKQWMTSQTFLDGIALGQVTPGPIVITATFVGFLQAGLPGALVATIGIFAPSLLMLTAAVPTFDRISHNRIFQWAMRGVLVSFTGLLLSVCLRFGMAIAWDTPRVFIVTATLLALWRTIDLLWIVLIGTLISAVML
jgi:chromate transporter